MILERKIENIHGTFGVLSLEDCFFLTLEKQWKDNQKNISRIPAGKYRITKELHAKLGKTIRLHDVPGRSGILVHSANLESELRGCIALGLGLLQDPIELNIIGISSSRRALDMIWTKKLPKTLTIQ